jgi:choline monooxygenase
LKSAPELGSVAGFDARSMGLIPLETAAWENWVFVKIERGGEPLENFLGPDLIGRFAALRLDRFHWFERRRYHVDCNWKVFIDNYLDGGYHVPHLHHALGRVLDYSQYTIENGVRFCLQSSPMTEERTGDLALYYWIYPNFMINRYADAMDTNLVVPRGVDQTEVIFDYYFTDVSDSARPRNLTSIAGSERVQDEDRMICESVQRGLQSGAYTAGRLSARREAGEYLFHRLLHTNLSAG